MSDAAIRDAINIIAGNHLADKVYAVDCTVVSVDVAKRTALVQIIAGKANNKFTARLMASIDDGVLLVPAVDSTVCVILSDFTAPYISLHSELDKILLISGSSTFEIKNGLIKMNDGSFDGLVKVVSLTTKLNALENKVNTIITTFNAHEHNTIAVGSPTAPPYGLIAGTLTPTQQSDIENTKVTHGQ